MSSFRNWRFRLGSPSFRNALRLPSGIDVQPSPECQQAIAVYGDAIQAHLEQEWDQASRPAHILLVRLA